MKVLATIVWELRDNRDFIFAEFTTTDTIYQLQPFLIQSRHRMNTPSSTATTMNINLIQPWPASQQARRHTPPVTQIPHIHHDNMPLPVATLVIVCTPTPIPPIITSTARYVSPLIIWFNPCDGCGFADGHLPGCIV